jgi:hypothetical protein
MLLVARERHLDMVNNPCLILHSVPLLSTGSSSTKLSLRVKRLSPRLAAAFTGTVADSPPHESSSLALHGLRRYAKWADMVRSSSYFSIRCEHC